VVGGPVGNDSTQPTWPIPSCVPLHVVGNPHLLWVQQGALVSSFGFSARRLQVLLFLLLLLLPLQVLCLILRKGSFWEGELQAGPSGSCLLHRPGIFIKLVDVHPPTGRTCSLAEIPSKERSTRRVDPVVPCHGKDRVQVILHW